MTKNHRLIVLGLLAAVLLVLFAFPPTSPNVESEIGLLLFSSAFLMSFTALLLEHFFARPTDVLAAAVSILFLVIPSRPMLSGWGNWYWVILVYEVMLIVIATAALLLLTSQEGETSIRNKVSRTLKLIATSIGSGKTQYFFFFLLTLLFYVEPRSVPFVSFLVYGLVVMLLEPDRLAPKIPAILRQEQLSVGTIFGVQGQNTFLAKLHPGRTRPALRRTDLLEFTYGMDEPSRVRRGLILERFYLDQEQWIRILCHDEIDARCADLEPLSNHRRDDIYRRDGHDAHAYLGALVGVVAEGTDITTLQFLQAGRAQVEEGDLVQVESRGGPVLYQVVNASIDTDTLESRNEADFVVGQATQLGRWNVQAGHFERYGWVPTARTPVTKAADIEPPTRQEDELRLGIVPGTNFPVLLNLKTAISHHLAVLGVTGVGKSVFSRNLIREMLADDLRVIVVDFTREWRGKLDDLHPAPMIGDEDAANVRKAINDLEKELAEFKNKQKEERITELKTVVFNTFRASLEGFLDGETQVGILELPDVSNTEGVLEYTQWFFKTLFHIARVQNNRGKRVCIVLEEAHTVVPEWNFIGLADKSSKALVNNISQIALQGRKYGIGFVVIAQRTASVSKTVLTQCNTVVAFQCFDGTSLEFLSHYLPKPVADTLPNLRARRAVAVGKAIRGSVPLIFEVPEINEPTLT